MSNTAALQPIELINELPTISSMTVPVNRAAAGTLEVPKEIVATGEWLASWVEEVEIELEEDDN